ncbi:MAG: RNA polymerase sporulation sigma factor SigK [Clostridia bacterium]|nr:RNA polymerase sporulation sigma factor SigK [Clostridia bacterium]
MAIEALFTLLKNLFIFSSYVVEKSSFPMPLTNEKEKYYLDRAESGDEEAKEILIKHNLRLVAHVAKKYANFGDNDELISVGSIGLIKAVSTYRQNKGTGLATYASRCIENEILMTLRATKKHKNNISLHEPIGVDKDGNELSVIDMIADDRDVIEEVERGILMERLRDITKACLDKREYEIIKYRYGLDGNAQLTQREIAQMFDISRSYISRIEKKALEKIKMHVSKEDLNC